MTKLNNFMYLKKIGEKTEMIIKNFLLDQGFIVEDVTREKVYQDKDIDLLAHKDGRKYAIEVKSDSKIGKNGNLFFEKGFHRKTGYKNGWMEYCEADYIFMYCEDERTVYIIDWKKHKADLARIGRLVKWYNKSDGCMGEGIVVSLDEATQSGLLVKTYIIDE